MRDKVLNSAALVLLILIWGTTWAAVRVGLAGIPPFLGISLRFLLASLVLLVAAKIAGVRFGKGRREWAMWLVNSLLAFSISYGRGLLGGAVDPLGSRLGAVCYLSSVCCHSGPLSPAG